MQRFNKKHFFRVTLQDIGLVMSVSSRGRRVGVSILFLCRRIIHFTLFSYTVVTGFLSRDTRNERTIRSRQRISGDLVYLLSSVEDKRQESNTVIEDEDEGEIPAGIGGAEFFGGNKQKEELYDPIAEREAGKDIKLKTTSFNRFFVSTDGAFDNEKVASMAQTLQRQINRELYLDDKKLKRIVERCNDSGIENLDNLNFGRSLSWETPMTITSQNPLEELKAAKDFYEEIDLAIVGGNEISEGIVNFFWKLSIVWPTFWSPRVVLSGSSTCTFATDTMTVTKQVDQIFGADNNFSLLSLLGNQIAPRFWDWYHIGMTPSAEHMPRRIISRNRGVTVYKIPPQLVAAPTIIETGTRENRHAQMVPNHAFTCIIRTMGAKKNNYVPTAPVEVQIGRNMKENKKDDRLLLSWSIPLSTQFQAVNEKLRLPVEENAEDTEGSFPTCDYSWLPSRKVATIKYGGNVQDIEISDIRKKLYEHVIKEGMKPKLDHKGKPKFFFWQNDVKACFIEEGLGMCVYEWRPKFVGSNEVGIELII